MKRAIVIISVVALTAVAATAGAVHLFPDVPDTHIFAESIEWASSEGLMNGYANGNFGPQDPITRGQVAEVFHRYNTTLDGTTQVAVGAATAINIGGSIGDNHTDLPGSHMTLEAGSYMINVFGAFEIIGLASPPECDLFGGVEVWPQITFFVDDDASGGYDSGEGVISPNVLMPDCNSRHANVAGSIPLTLDAPTTVGLIAFGYNSAGSSEGTGEISGGGMLVANLIGTLTTGGDTFSFPGERDE
jgi:hypothetical protein